MGRRHDYSQRLPSHYCQNCSQVVFDDDLVCPHCQTAPEGEWPSIQDGFDAWLGRVLDGRYVITRRIGQGAMGTVYKAESLAIARQFAVKIINFKEGASGLDPAQIRARLHREIEAIGRLRNPHVVLFYEVLELFDHFVGVVMDYIDGETLEHVVLSEGPMNPRRALQILRQVANGVHEAHQAGMIHRDLKPENVMVEVLPAGDDFAHVLDFGIVRMDDGVSMTKGFLGTPLYASPEQAMGGELDRRSDIYSLGAMLFFTLTSHAPFESDNVYDILQAHVRRPPPSLQDVFGRAFAPAIEALVASMLAKNPEKRPQTLAHVISAVDRMLRFGDFDDIVPDSMDLVFSPSATQAGPPHETEPGLDIDSSSVFESTERDRTGPKAAIFRRASRSGVQEAIAEQQRAGRSEFDRVYQGNTGASTLGISVEGDVELGACAANGAFVLKTTQGICVAREGDVRDVGQVPNVSAVGVSAVTALAGSDDGHIYELTEAGPVSLFEDVRRAAVTAVAMSFTDAVWLLGSEAGRLYRCNPPAGKKVWLRISDGPAIAALALDAHADTFAIARRHGEVEVTYLATPKQPFSRFSTKSGAIRDITLSDNGRLLAVLFEDNCVWVHLVDTGQAVHKLRDEKYDIFTVAFVGDELLGYFVSEGRMYARKLDRAESTVKN